jgi:DNA polymerase elongation subunit (family B)
VSELLEAMQARQAKITKQLAQQDIKALTVDIENAPNIVHTWGLFKQNIGISQIVKPAYTFGVGYKWYHEKQAHFLSDHVHGHKEMVERTHALLDEADMVIGFNHVGFDLPHINRESVLLGLGPNRPYKNVDLLRVARKQFRFTSNKLDFLAQQLGLGSKTAHTGHDLWVRCLDGDPAAWKLMEKYCKQDVVLTEKLYNRLLPWIPNHPHRGVWLGDSWACPNCGHDIDPESAAEQPSVAHVTAYNTYQCPNCTHWTRGTLVRSQKLKTRSTV